MISSPEALANFEHTLRRFLAYLEQAHGKIGRLAVFPAVPLSCGITLGRVLMPHISPALVVFDRDPQRVFFPALEVRR